MARRFFSELGALRKHAHNLKDLRIEPVYEGDWCFDTYNVDAVCVSSAQGVGDERAL